MLGVFAFIRDLSEHLLQYSFFVLHFLFEHKIEEIIELEGEKAIQYAYLVCKHNFSTTLFYASHNFQQI